MTEKRRMLVDVKSLELAEHFMSEIEGHSARDITELAEAIQSVCEDYCSDVEDAVRAACTCRMSSVSSASIDPPHVIVDQWCPIHGRDPDYEYQKMKDEGR